MFVIVSSIQAGAEDSAARVACKGRLPSLSSLTVVLAKARTHTGESIDFETLVVEPR
jgi:hypothetical protein